MKTRVIALSAVAGLASIASAQNPTFTYSIDAPAALNPGQTAVITVLCGFTPGVGQNVTTSLGALPVMGLESGGFSLTASGGSWAGLSLMAPVNFPLGTSAGTIAGSNVNGAIFGTGFVPPAVPSSVNPTPVWQGTFTMPATGIATLTVTGNGNHFLWAQHPVLAVTTNGATAAMGQAVITPAPASLALLGLGGLVAARRRR